FVTVHGARPKRVAATAGTRAFTPVFDGLSAPVDLPAPALPAIDQTYGIIVTGIGGTGIVTVGAILGMAAHLGGQGAGVLGMAAPSSAISASPRGPRTFTRSGWRRAAPISFSAATSWWRAPRRFWRRWSPASPPWW